MIPILYDYNETAFASNGLCRLRDAISVIVTEERNGIYECDFEYPVDGANFDLIKCGRIIGVVHDDSDDIQPFDIISFTRPINGIVTFHCVHISYRQRKLTVSGTNINSLADALDMFAESKQEKKRSGTTVSLQVGIRLICLCRRPPSPVGEGFTPRLFFYRVYIQSRAVS